MNPSKDNNVTKSCDYDPSLGLPSTKVNVVEEVLLNENEKIILFNWHYFSKIIFMLY